MQIKYIKNGTQMAHFSSRFGNPRPAFTFARALRIRQNESRKRQVREIFEILSVPKPRETRKKKKQKKKLPIL